MQVLQGLAIVLTLQSVGEALSRWLHLPYPGPVIGMVLLLVALRWPAVQLLVVIVASTWIGLAVTALVLRRLMRHTPTPGDRE
jgi:putative effector of murein hydrolase LrgA (UPF0299 family)